MSLRINSGVQMGPLMLSSLVKHFFARSSTTKDSKARDELAYDEAFTVIRFFMEVACKHPVEQLQQLSNTKVPASPSMASIRLVIPMSCCDEAAHILIAALGGQEMTKKIAGGTRWWQVRGMAGVEANWVANRKQWNRAQRQNSASDAQNKTRPSTEPPIDQDNKASENDTYTPELDTMPCMLYFHGGGYFFGSSDQERLCINRYSRKMNGRVFAVNYRLSPQYPFPCQIQDAIAAYLYLIRPPPGAMHKPISPSQIVFNGASAGGGLLLALLQVIRDQGLPMPAGAILVSPWGDLTHSFPSTFENTASDIIPKYGLSTYKPSVLWPPPPDEMATKVRSTLTDVVKSSVRNWPALDGISPNDEGLRAVIGDTVLTDKPSSPEAEVKRFSHQNGATDSGTKLGLVPGVDYYTPPIARGQPIRGTLDGQEFELKSQIQLYAMNHQLTHPFVSPALAYLGGLCPLFVLASDKEVIRDEIIYIAHKAANPGKYPLRPETAEIYPAHKEIEKRHGPTDVHLQVFDETCHTLPIFTFTTPAIYSYRAMAAFCKFVTKLPNVRAPLGRSQSLFSNQVSSPVFDVIQSPIDAQSPIHTHSLEQGSSGFPLPSPENNGTPEVPKAGGSPPISSLSVGRSAAQVRRPTSKLALSIFRRRGNTIFKYSSTGGKGLPRRPAEPSNHKTSHYPELEVHGTKSERGYAGHPYVYADAGGLPFSGHMIRERVATNGQVRPMEPESEIRACNHPAELIGMISPAGMQRYLEGQKKWDHKYVSAATKVTRKREKNIEQWQKEAAQQIGKLQQKPGLDGTAEGRTLLNAPGFSLTWALDGENPPPSSLVFRRDTAEARRLAQTADVHLEERESRLSGNNLWAAATSVFTGSVIENDEDPTDPDDEPVSPQDQLQ